MNAPTIAPEIQQEAARSLLERLGEKNALVRFFRYNASAKHGVPIDPPNSIVFGGQPSENTTTTTNTSNTTTTQPGIGVNGTTGVNVPVKATEDTIRLARSTENQTPNQPNISVNVAAPTAPATGNDNYMKGVLYTIVALAGLGGAAILGYVFAKPEVPTIAPTTSEPQQIPQSPLQFLEDIGAHLPENFDDNGKSN